MTKKIFALLTGLLLCYSCSNEDESIDANNCPVTKITSNEFNKVEYVYDDNNKLIQIKDFNNQLADGLTYYLNYKSDNSIIVSPTDFNGGISANIYMELKYSGNKIVELKEYEGAKYLYKFDYKKNEIRVSQIYFTFDINNNIEYNNAAYGDYFLDSNNNVSRIKWYTYDLYNGGNGSDTATLIADITYTYDNYPNPWKNIIFPTFRNGEWISPLPIFFSNNNITIIKHSNGPTQTLSNEYNGSQIVKGGYFNTEYYIYKCF